MSSTGHKTVRSGKRVRVKMKDGSWFFAKFKENKGKHLEFFDHDSVSSKDVKGITIWKQSSTPLSSMG